MVNTLQYRIEEGDKTRVEITRRRGDNLLLQVFPKREITANEAASQKDGSPVWKIIQAIEQYNPRHIEVHIRVPQETLDITYFTVEFKDFYQLPTDTKYLCEKITKALRLLTF